MKDRIVVCVFATVAVAILIAMIPFARRIERNYFLEDAVSGAQAEARLDATRRRALFGEGMLIGSLTVTIDGQTRVYQISQGDLGCGCHYTGEPMRLYDGYTQDGQESIEIRVSMDFDWIFVREAYRRGVWAGHVDQSKVQETLDNLSFSFNEKQEDERL